MCDDHGHAHVPPVEIIPTDADWNDEVLPLEPVDEVSVLTVCDNTVDMLLVDQGPATRLGLSSALGGSVPLIDAPTLQDGTAIDAPLAEHGFSALVEIRKGNSVHRLLFDTGLTPDGCVDNLRRLGRDPGDIEVIVCSHGHFDHATGLSGLIDRLVLGVSPAPAFSRRAATGARRQLGRHRRSRDGRPQGRSRHR